MENIQNLETAYFGGGCFWCTEAVFQELRGVKAVVSGYAGGSMENPDYEAVSSGKSGHAEVVKIEYDPGVISYRTLLEVFFATHDPTTANRQGADIGEQYRSVILYIDGAQRAEAEKYISELNASGELSGPVVTRVKPLEKFFSAEEYHQDFFSNNPDQPYCRVIINPKLEKLRKKFSKLIIKPND